MATAPGHRHRIAVVIPKYGLTGGAERFAASLTERLALNPGYDLHVFANQWASLSHRVTFHRVPIITFPRFLTTVSFAWFAQRAVARQHCDLIHSHERIFSADLFTMHGVPHRYWSREIRGKGIMSLHDRVTAWVEEKLPRDDRCQFLLPVSSLALSCYRREFPKAAGKLRVLHPGIDLAQFTVANRDAVRERIRHHFGLTPSDFVILFVGMNFELKGLQTLIAAVAQARAQNPTGRGIKLVVVGKGDQERYRKVASSYGVSEAVLFAGVQEQGIEEFYAAADVHALLSGFDTFGMTVLEAMATGLPVIISSMVGAKDLVVDGTHGYIVDKDDMVAVSDRIIALLDEKRRCRMGQACRQVAVGHSWDTITQEVSRLYDQILANR